MGVTYNRYRTNGRKVFRFENNSWGGGYSMGVINITNKSILCKDKKYCIDTGQMEERYFVLKITTDEKGRVRHIPLTQEDYPECKKDGIVSLRKAKTIHLLNSI